MDETYVIKELNFPHVFFEDSVREDFFVPTMMKRFWAAQMEVLKVFSEICGRHDIPWFAGEGTLLGAVRHKGYIPWDDDIDLYLMRADFARFLEAARQEMPETYRAFTIYDHEEILPCTIRMVNDTAVQDGYEYLKRYHGCPYVVGLDIFALDSVFDDPEEEAKRMEKVRHIRTVCDKIEAGKTQDSAFRQALLLVEKDSGLKIKQGKNLNHFLQRMKEDLYASCKADDTKKVAIYWELWPPVYFDRDYFRERVPMPFEIASVPVPKDYEGFLRSKYGDYNVRVRAGGGHGYPCYTVQQEVIDQNGKFNSPRYLYQAEDFTKERETDRRTYALRVAQMLSQVYGQTDALRAGGREEEASALEAGAKKLEDTFANLTADTGGRDWLDGRREVVFLACRAEWWKTMERTVRRFQHEEGTDVSVICIPWYEKELDGSASAEHNEKDLFPKDIRVLSPEEYRIEGRCPDVIVTQFPYDGWNRTVTIPPFYFAVNLRQFTERLIYIPCYDVPTPDAADDKAIISLQNLIEQPAVMYADEVWLPDEGMRTLYVESLCALGGEEIRELCEKRIRVNPVFSGGSL